ncbi:SOUL family heme-binding protein [Lacisediminihabitans changchengi]|uniref:Heme-binding protein n=1 Tax=Lacisediminihabitans changchengi TaxID=2787634 RepID=A0A934W3E0_9MICO|nr:heme-binding protein [Lacisediminihabitans changchengi]MBK4347071.1 heme-binding protein [Lacisediminihabitans changchengi]MBK4347806.1 heme-binding protein [Lacisediminihabitans changchengi]
MTEQQPYETVRSERAFELRRYPEHVVAETQVSGDFESAGTQAFRYLFGYINGQNAARRSIAMTAPVVQGSSQRIAMTAPVVQTESRGAFTVAFVLPAGLSEASAPVPTRSEVALRTVAPRLVAAARFTGRWSQGSYEEHRSALLVALADAGLTPVGEPWFARFDPPFTPWFLRHNEVLVQVAQTA